MEVAKNFVNTVKRYQSYGVTIKHFMAIAGIAVSRYYGMKKRISEVPKPSRRGCKSGANKIRKHERIKIIGYAKKHPEYNHREMTYRMIDENVAFVSKTTTYRILKEAGMIGLRRKNKKKYGWKHRYNNHATSVNERWQTDITYIEYRERTVYQLSFIDVYSRYIVGSYLLTDMTSKTVKEKFEELWNSHKGELQQKPIIQSDNGSCYIGSEFKGLIKLLDLDHEQIHPGAPTENVIIERWHRTLKEILEEKDEPKSFEELKKLIKEVCKYYNEERYHSGIGYVTPLQMYNGEAQNVLEERAKKLALARKKRMTLNTTAI